MYSLRYLSACRTENRIKSLVDSEVKLLLFMRSQVTERDIVHDQAVPEGVGLVGDHIVLGQEDIQSVFDLPKHVYLMGDAFYLVLVCWVG